MRDAIGILCLVISAVIMAGCFMYANLHFMICIGWYVTVMLCIVGTRLIKVE